MDLAQGEVLIYLYPRMSLEMSSNRKVIGGSQNIDNWYR
jgi:hypothetical protein